MTDHSSRFHQLVQGPEAQVPLDEAALLIAAHAYPDLDVSEELGRLDALAEGCPSPDLAGVRAHLFDDLGFTGTTRHYAHPRHSFLNEVLRRRRGIPISLSVLTMEVARRVGVVLRGVGMPGHFLVVHEGHPTVLLDPFSGGRTVDREGAEGLFRAVFGPTAAFDDSMLAPVGPRAILVRMLLNLRQMYTAAGDARSLGWVLRLRASVPARTIEERFDLAGTQAALGRFDEAAVVMGELSEEVGDEQVAAQARAEAQRLRAHLN